MRQLVTSVSIFVVLAGGFAVSAQDTAIRATPDAPGPRAAAAPPVPVPGDAWYAPVARSRKPQTVHDKLMDYAVVTFGPRALFSPAFSSAIRMANPRDGYPRDWRLGAGAFGRNYGDALARRTSTGTGRYLASALLHEDFRYRPSAGRNPLARGFHAVAFTFVDKSDSGGNRIALANFIGAGAGGFVGNLYLPAGYNNLSHAGTRAGTAFAGFAAQNLLREFSPELFRFTQKLHLPFPRIPVPEWWTKRY